MSSRLMGEHARRLPGPPHCTLIKTRARSRWPGQQGRVAASASTTRRHTRPARLASHELSVNTVLQYTSSKPPGTHNNVQAIGPIHIHTYCMHCWRQHPTQPSPWPSHQGQLQSGRSNVSALKKNRYNIHCITPMVCHAIEYTNEVHRTAIKAAFYGIFHRYFINENV